MTTNEYLRRPEAKGYVKVLEVLRLWDPIGVISEDNQDEYEFCAAPVVRHMDQGSTVDAVFALLKHIAEEDMGIGVDEAHTRACAEELVRFWKDWKPGVS